MEGVVERPTGAGYPVAGGEHGGKARRRPAGNAPAARRAAGVSARAAARAHDPDYWLLVTIVALVVFGTVIIFSATFAIDLPDGGGSFYYLKRQLFFVLLGAGAALCTGRTDYHVWRRYSIPVLAVAIVLLLLVRAPGIGVNSGGAHRWLDLGPLPQFQPSELAKVALILYMADWLTKRGPRLRDWRTGVIPFAVILGGLIFLVMIEPDLGTSSLLAIIGITMFLVAGADLRQFALFLGSGALAFVGLALAAPYRRDRLELFRKSEAELASDLNGGWQLFQARLSFGSGGLFGVGLGASRLKYGWLPAAHTDAIFAVVGEELGLFGCACLLALFLLLAVRGYRVAFRARDPFGALLATGIVSWIVFQALINIGGITTTIPFTGVPLPFVSYGGTSLVVVMAAVGVLLNISRQTERGGGNAERRTGARPSRQETHRRPTADD